MPTLYTQIGPWRLQTFTLALGVVIVLSLVIMARRSQARGQVVDACLVALVGGITFARLFHVLLNWDYFVDNLPEARNIAAGGLDWHGAVIGGVIGLGIAVNFQRSGLNDWLSAAGGRLSVFIRNKVHTVEASVPKVPVTVYRGMPHSFMGAAHHMKTLQFNVLLDWLTPALPLIGLGSWYGCLAAGCGYGREVDTLANFPVWAASEYVDVFGIVLPRLNTPYFGMLLCGLGLVVVGMTGLWRRWHARRTDAPTQPVLRAHGRFWVVLALLSTGMFGIGFFRGDHSFYWYSLRADQILDIIIALWGVSVVIYQRSGISHFRNRSDHDEQAAR